MCVHKFDVDLAAIWVVATLVLGTTLAVEEETRPGGRQTQHRRRTTQAVRLSRPVGRLTFSMLWSEKAPTVTLSWPVGRLTFSMLCECDAQQAGRQTHLLHAVVEVGANCEAKHAGRQTHLLPALDVSVRLDRWSYARYSHSKRKVNCNPETETLSLPLSQSLKS